MLVIKLVPSVHSDGYIDQYSFMTTTGRVIMNLTFTFVSPQMMTGIKERIFVLLARTVTILLRRVSRLCRVRLTSIWRFALIIYALLAHTSGKPQPLDVVLFAAI